MKDQDLRELVVEIAKKAKEASFKLAKLSSEEKNAVLRKVAQKLRERK